MDLTVEEGQRLKVIFGSHTGFHVIDVDSGNSYDIYIPSHVSTWTVQLPEEHGSPVRFGQAPRGSQGGTSDECDIPQCFTHLKRTQGCHILHVHLHRLFLSSCKSSKV